MSNSWKEWEGQTIDGKFPLIRFAGESEYSVVFLTERTAGNATAPAAIKIIPAGPDQGERQLEKWRQAAELSHPNLAMLYEMGRCELGGIAALYVVMDRAEENLAQIMPGRALAVDEARIVLKTVADVVSYLHTKGLVHGRIKPSNIMASGDELKISADALSSAGDPIYRRRDVNVYDPPEYQPGVDAVPHTMGPSGDVWSLGMLLVEAFAQTLPIVDIGRQKNPQIPDTLPNPFLGIARQCLVRNPQERWTAIQITDCLQGRNAAPEPLPAPPVTRKTEAPARPEQPKKPIQQQPKQAAAGLPKQTARQRSFAFQILVALAALLVVVILGVKFFRSSSQPTPAIAGLREQPAISAPQAPVRAPAPALAVEVETATTPPPKHQQEISELARPRESPKSKTSVPSPASIQPTGVLETSSRVANLSTANPARGEVVRQSMPQVLAAARNTIRGTVRVIVKVSVDREGNVEGADLVARGPSNYFAREALQAARLWKFKPPRIGGASALSSWRLQFAFTRDGAKVVSTQEIP